MHFFFLGQGGLVLRKARIGPFFCPLVFFFFFFFCIIIEEVFPVSREWRPLSERCCNSVSLPYAARSSTGEFANNFRIFPNLFFN